MNKRYKWLDMHGQYISKNATMTNIDFIQCGECGYITNPILTTFKIGKDSYGLLTLPQTCPQCKTDMEFIYE